MICHRLSPVIQKTCNAIHWMNHYLVDKPNGFINTYPLTWDQAQFERFSYILSNGYRENWFRHARRNVIYKAKRKQSLISGYLSTA